MELTKGAAKRRINKMAVMAERRLGGIAKYVDGIEKCSEFVDEHTSNRAKQLRRYYGLLMDCLVDMEIEMMC